MVNINHKKRKCFTRKDYFAACWKKVNLKYKHLLFKGHLLTGGSPSIKYYKAITDFDVNGAECSYSVFFYNDDPDTLYISWLDLCADINKDEVIEIVKGVMNNIELVARNLKFTHIKIDVIKFVRLINNPISYNITFNMIVENVLLPMKFKKLDGDCYVLDL